MGLTWSQPLLWVSWSWEEILTRTLPWISDPEGGICLRSALYSLLPAAVMLPGRKPPHGNISAPVGTMWEMWAVWAQGHTLTCHLSPHLLEQAFPPWQRCRQRL